MNGSSRQKYTHVSQLITSNPQMTQLRQKQQKMIMMIKKLKRRIKEKCGRGIKEKNEVEEKVKVGEKEGVKLVGSSFVVESNSFEGSKTQERTIVVRMKVNCTSQLRPGNMVVTGGYLKQRLIKSQNNLIVAKLLEE